MTHLERLINDRVVMATLGTFSRVAEKIAETLAPS
jgi:hypothetical protein